MSEANHREQDIFNQCLSLPPARRSTYLKSACVGDSELLLRVERLLSAHLRAECTEQDQFDRIAGDLLRAALDADTGGCAASPGSGVPGYPAEPCPGETIASWRLVRKIGEGGMASVWLAEGSGGHPDPPVAIKLPLGNSPWRVFSERMAHEREVLLTLNHPN